MSTLSLFKNINSEDKTVTNVLEKAIPKIEVLVGIIVSKMKNGGVKMIMDELNIDEKLASKLLLKHKKGRKIFDEFNTKFN